MKKKITVKKENKTIVTAVFVNEYIESVKVNTYKFPSAFGVKAEINAIVTALLEYDLKKIEHFGKVHIESLNESFVIDIERYYRSFYEVKMGLGVYVPAYARDRKAFKSIEKFLITNNLPIEFLGKLFDSWDQIDNKYYARAIQPHQIANNLPNILAILKEKVNGQIEPDQQYY